MRKIDNCEVRASSVEFRRRRLASVVFLVECWNRGSAPWTGTLITTEIIITYLFWVFNHIDNFSYISPDLSVSISDAFLLTKLLICELFSPTFGACQTKAAVSKHLITACRDSQDWHSWQSLNCLRFPLSSELKSGMEKERQKRDLTDFKTPPQSCVSAGDTQFKWIYQWRWQQSRCPLQTRSRYRWYLCQSLDVRDFRVQVVSDTSGGFESDSCHLSSRECPTEDVATSQSQHGVWIVYCSLHTFWSSVYYCSVTFVLDIEIVYYTASLCDGDNVTERQTGN